MVAAGRIGTSGRVAGRSAGLSFMPATLAGCPDGGEAARAAAAPLPELRQVLVLAGADQVALGVLEVAERPDPVELERLRRHPPAARLDRAHQRADVGDAERDLEAARAHAGLQLAPPLQPAVERRAGVAHDIEVRRTPGLIGPAEHPLVESLGALHVVGV